VDGTAWRTKKSSDHWHLLSLNFFNGRYGIANFFNVTQRKDSNFLCSRAWQTSLIILFIGGNFDQLWKLIKLSVCEKFIEGNIRVNRFELAAKLPLKHLPLTDALYGSLHCLVLTIPHAPVIRFIKSMLARSSM